MSRMDSKKARIYEINGHQYYSVTTILGVISAPQLTPWAAKITVNKAIELFGQCVDKETDTITMTRSLAESLLLTAKREHREYTKRAGELGQEAHADIERVLHNQEPISQRPEVKCIIASLKAWLADRKFVPVDIEMEVYSKQFSYAGTLDCCGYFQDKPDELVIIDWKTGNHLYSEAKLQTSAYAQALSEMRGVEIKKACIVRFLKTEPKPDEPKYEEIYVEDTRPYLPTFLAAFAVWSWKNAEGE